VRICRMPLIPDGVRRLVEEPEAYLADPPPPTRLIRAPSYVLSLNPTPTQSMVSAVRTTAQELDRIVAEVRAQVRAAGHTRTVWAVGPSCRPEGLGAALVERGFFPPTQPPYEPEMTGMALVEPPPPGPPGVEARLVRDFDEYLDAMRIAVATMGEGESESEDEGWLGAARSYWEHPGGAAPHTHVAFVEGRMVGFGFAVTTPVCLILNGSGVRPAWRGRGAYRALVASRWSEAVSLGTPALAIQAGAMSRPILERCGFATLGRLHLLQDPEVT
jgi:GNAT superfamily N-acetyltransferase